MKPILIAFTTNSGSTEEVAKAIAEELGLNGTPVEIRRAEEVSSLEPYGAVVVGAPMILGWHGHAFQFIKKHRAALAQIPVAFFATALRLTSEGSHPGDFPSLTLDPNLLAAPKNPKRPSVAERYSAVSHYLRPMLRAAPAVRPVSVAFFGGKLALYLLPWWQMLFVLLVVRARPGDSRNWPFIRAWGAELKSAFLSSYPVPVGDSSLGLEVRLVFKPSFRKGSLYDFS